MNNKEKLLAILFTEEQALHARLLARKTGMSQNTILTKADELEKEGIITKKTEYNRVLITPSNSAIYKRKKIGVQH